MTKIIHKAITLLICTSFLSACATTIQPVGTLGSQNLNVYKIAQNDLLGSNRMLVILDKKGNVVAYAGGTTTSIGELGMQAISTATSAGAIVYSAKAVEKGLQSMRMNANVKGIPSSIDIHAYGHLKK